MSIIKNCQNLMLLTSSDTRRTLMHLFLFTKRTGFNMYAEYTRPQLTFLALYIGLDVLRLTIYCQGDKYKLLIDI